MRAASWCARVDIEESYVVVSLKHRTVAGTHDIGVLLLDFLLALSVAFSASTIPLVSARTSYQQSVEHWC